MEDAMPRIEVVRPEPMADRGTLRTIGERGLIYELQPPGAERGVLAMLVEDRDGVDTAVDPEDGLNWVDVYASDPFDWPVIRVFNGTLTLEEVR
jgi:hypothetical protein